MEEWGGKGIEETREEKSHTTSWKSRTWRKWRKHDYLECREERRGKIFWKKGKKSSDGDLVWPVHRTKGVKRWKGARKENSSFLGSWWTARIPGQRKGVELEAGLNYEEKWFLRQGEATWKAKTPERFLWLTGLNLLSPFAFIRVVVGPRLCGLLDSGGVLVYGEKFLGGLASSWRATLV